MGAPLSRFSCRAPVKVIREAPSVLIESALTQGPAVLLTPGPPSTGKARGCWRAKNSQAVAGGKTDAGVLFKDGTGDARLPRSGFLLQVQAGRKQRTDSMKSWDFEKRAPGQGVEAAKDVHHSSVTILLTFNPHNTPVSLHGTPAEKETWWPQVTLSALCAKASGIYTAFLCCAPTPRLQPPQYTSTAANALTHLQPHKAQVGQLPAMTPTTSWASSSSQVDAEASNWEIDRTHTNWASGKDPCSLPGVCTGQ
nr:uncharacterized protein LOC103226781 isoform X2 [Chlorocebus sabaeus]